jgi:hypothetical protein
VAPDRNLPSVAKERNLARDGAARAGAHGVNKVDFLVYTACTRVQTVSLDPYSCTGEVTPSIQVYTPDESTRAAVQPASLQMYSCECRAMCTARLCSTHHSRAMHSCTHRITRLVRRFWADLF